MILTSNGSSNSRMRLKKPLFLENVEEESAGMSTHSCEFGPDGIRFMRDNIKVTKEGLCKITEDEITPLSMVRAEDIEYGAEIGRGASGVVKEGIYKPQNVPVAVKTISIYDRDKRRQVVNDLKIFLQDRLEQVKGNDTELSNYIVQVYGAYYDEGSIKIILELMDAGSLRCALNMAKNAKKTGPYIEEPYLANIAYQILSGLHFIHYNKKQIHRDIKPENVLINSLGQVKLSDFGISRQLEETHAFSKTFVGTVTYMSPERLVGEPYGFSSDLWSLGLILIELATGEYPYKKTKKFIEMLQNIRNLPEPNLPENGLYSDEFRDFITKCLQKDPSKRSTAAQLMEHPWLIQNSELNLDLSEWISNLLFTCKYAEPSENVNFNLGEMETVCDDRPFFQENEKYEEQKIDTPSFINHPILEQPKLQRYYSFGDVYDSTSNQTTTYSPNSISNLPESMSSKGHSTRSIFGLSQFGTKSKGFSFEETETPSSKKTFTMDFEIENFE